MFARLNPSQPTSVVRSGLALILTLVWLSACSSNNSSKVTPSTSGTGMQPPTVVPMDEGQVLHVFNADGLASEYSVMAFTTEEESPFSGAQASQKIKWQMSEDGVLQVTTTATNAQGARGVLGFARTPADFSAYSDGEIVFDIRANSDYNDLSGLIVKVDCVHPCSSGDIFIGQVGQNNAWETVTLSVAEMVANGLDLSKVSMGLVIFPHYFDQLYQGTSFAFEIRNLRWRSNRLVPPTPDPDPSAYTDSLVWSDEFDGTSLNTDNWDIQMGDGSPDLPSGWGNSEEQSYTGDPANLRLRGGMLEITAVRSGNAYTSARIRTFGKQSFRYKDGKTVRIEARMKLPGSQGLWPAFWMLPEENLYGTWPQSGEIDIMEAVNLGVGGKTDTTFAAHYGMPNPDNTYASSGYDTGLAPNDNFNVFAVEWSAGEIRWYVNDVHAHTQTAAQWFTLSSQNPAYELLKGGAPFDRAFHILLNVAVGGNLPGPPNAQSVFPQTMQVDYVRVYDCATEASQSRCHRVSPFAPPNNLGAGVLGFRNGLMAEINVYDSGLQTHTEGIGASMENVTFVAQASDAGVAVNPSATNGQNQVLELDFDASGGVVALTTVAGQGSGPAQFTLRRGDVHGQLEFDLRVRQLASGSSLQFGLGTDADNRVHESYSNAKLQAIADSNQSQSQVLNLNQLSRVGTFSYENVTELFSVVSAGSFSGSQRTVVEIDNVRIRVYCPLLNARCGAGLASLNPLPVDPNTPTEVHASASLDASEDLTMYPNTRNAFINAFETTGFTELISVGTLEASLTTATDTAHGQVVECSAQSSQVICGLKTANGVTIDLSAFAGGVLEFDLLIVTSPTDPTANMMFKVETTETDATEISLGPANTFTTGQAWRRVRVDLASEPWTSLNLNLADAISVYPTWGKADGAVWQIDNIKLYRP